MNVKLVKDTKSKKTVVQISLKDWKEYEKEHKKLLRSNKLNSSIKRVTNRKSKESEIIRDFVSKTNSFSFWENSKEDLYQDYLFRK